MKILVVEDSRYLLRSLGHGLKRLGHAVDLVSDGRDAFDFARFNDYDVIVLDLVLPRMHGLELLERVRKLGIQTPVLILSARGSVRERIRGLELGADDYLVKPFDFEELTARLNALARRRYNEKNPEIDLGPVVLDTAARKVSRHGKPVTLTRGEYSVLEYLARNRGRVLSKDQISDAVHASDAFCESKVVEVLVCTLRRKIGDGNGGSVVKTRRGYGYLVE